MITRRKDYIRRAPSKDASKIYIVCEGAETEKNYFSFFEGLSSNLKLIVIPPEEGTDPLKLMSLAKEIFLSDSGRYSLDYMQKDQIWFAIDTDSWAMEGKIKPLRDFSQNQNALIPQQFSEVKPYSAWNVAQSNPCFEIWLYYHHYNDIPDEDLIKSYTSVKAFVDSMISGGFDFQRDPSRIEDAIRNAETNFSRLDSGNPKLYSTEQFLLGKEIFEFVGTEIRKLRNKFG